MPYFSHFVVKKRYERGILMRQITIKTAAVLNASPTDVYATIADYRVGHPAILPKGKLYDLTVEQGGYGQGTTMRFKAKSLGIEQDFYHRVTEPDPGHILVEQDIDSWRNSATTFTVTPVNEGRQAHVEIATTLNSSRGFQGLLERLLVPLVQPPIYRKELKLLEEVAHKRGRAAI